MILNVSRVIGLLGNRPQSTAKLAGQLCVCTLRLPADDKARIVACFHTLKFSSFQNFFGFFNFFSGGRSRISFPIQSLSFRI